MTEAEIADLAQRWASLQRLPQDSPEAKALMPAATQMFKLEFMQPQVCWKVVMKIFNETDDEWVLTNLAAGPIESLLARHPDQVLPLVEHEAGKNERFRLMLQGTWKNLMTDETWRRLNVARS